MTLPNVVKHHLYRVAEIGHFPGNRLRLLLHQVVELSTLIGERFECFLHFREAHLAGLDKRLHLVFSHAKLLSQLVGNRNSAPHELSEILREKTPLRHRCSIQVDEIIQGYGKPGRDVTKPHKDVVDIICGYTVCKELFGFTGHFLHPEWRGCSCAGELLHQAVGGLFVPQHGFEGRLELLELATHGSHLYCKIFRCVEREGYAHHSPNALGGLPQPLDNAFCLACIALEAAIVYSGGQIERTVVV